MSRPPNVRVGTSPDGKPQIVVASTTYPSNLPLVVLPLRPIFPKTVAPLLIGHPDQAKLVSERLEAQQNLIGLVLARKPKDDDSPSPGGPVAGDAPQSVQAAAEADIYSVGVVAQILRAQPVAPGGPLQVLAGGLDRFRIDEVLTREPHMLARVTYLQETALDSEGELRAHALAVINTVKELVQLNPLFKQELNILVQQGSIEEPGRLADYAAYLTSAKGEDLQRVLETLDIRQRLERVLELLRREIDITKMQAEIRERIEQRISKQQREFFLREQLKAIKKELGLERDDKEDEIQRFVDRLEGLAPTTEARERIDEQVDKLRVLEPASPEYHVTRTYLDWLTALPWGVVSEGEVTLAAARDELESSHFGLDDVKDRILELVAAGILKGSFSGSIVLLVGPPGVGKSSVGRSIATALGRPFFRFSLGGMRDEAEIKGHRRTYIGAMPGKFIQALRVCKRCDPVIMLDEIDKVGASYRGDPASALLEALDPEQNNDFLDHYLDVRFDLSRVLFVCTANQLDTIPRALLDRMELIKLSGYLLQEKLEIARRFLVPRQLAAHGLSRRRLTITKAALRELCDGYARDPGVRTAEKLITKVVRKCAVRALEHGEQRIKIDRGDIEGLLGRRVFRMDGKRASARPGVVTGLAWTSLGGATLSIEAVAVKGRAGFKQTGQLGKVMVESSEIAYTTVRRLCAELPRCATFFDKHFVHLHVPAGATPKDGPSAGITMATALYTLATGRPPRAHLAMTGELNLAGDVMVVGGIKEKVIAARRARLRQVLMPADNEGDWEQLEAHVRGKLVVRFVATLDEVIAWAVR